MPQRPPNGTSSLLLRPMTAFACLNAMRGGDSSFPRYFLPEHTVHVKKRLHGLFFTHLILTRKNALSTNSHENSSLFSLVDRFANAIGNADETETERWNGKQKIQWKPMHFFDITERERKKATSAMEWHLCKKAVFFRWAFPFCPLLSVNLTFLHGAIKIFLRPV